jgi:hypothetical protein
MASTRELDDLTADAVSLTSLAARLKDQNAGRAVTGAAEDAATAAWERLEAAERAEGEAAA